MLRSKVNPWGAKEKIERSADASRVRHVPYQPHHERVMQSNQGNLFDKVTRVAVSYIHSG